MAREISKENVFGQVLICLRMSKLDYVIKETPYAGYVTVRKKFMKNVDFEKDILIGTNEKAKDESILVKEVKELKTTIAMLRFENEEFEIQNDTLKRDIAAQDDKIEEAYCETRHFKEQLKIGDIEKGGLIQSLEDKNLQIVGLEKELL